MKRKRKSPSLLGLSLFIAFVAVSGYVLSYNGYIDNPFDNISFSAQQLSGNSLILGGTAGGSPTDFGGGSLDGSALNASGTGSLELSASGLDSSSTGSLDGSALDASGTGSLELSATDLNSSTSSAGTGSLDANASGTSGLDANTSSLQSVPRFGDEDFDGGREGREGRGESFQASGSSTSASGTSAASDLPVLSSGGLSGGITAPTGFAAPAVTVQATPRGGDFGSINWSDLGSVLFDLWFICAVTAAFIVVQQIYLFITRQIKSRLAQSKSAQPV